MAAKIFIFDLDGTLLNTLEDLADAVNHALQQFCLPTQPLEAVRMMVGNGVRNLVLRGAGLYTYSPAEGVWTPVPADEAPVSMERFEEIFDCFKAYYVGHCQVKTRLYDGIADLLYKLRARKCRIAIVSNKLQAGVDELRQAYFSDLVDVAIGEREGIACKPAPDMVDAALSALCRKGESVEELRAQSVYIGDSDVDVLTAQRAAMPCVSVLWGFRDEAFLRQHGATLFAHQPADILALMEEKE